MAAQAAAEGCHGKGAKQHDHARLAQVMKQAFHRVRAEARSGLMGSGKLRIRATPMAGAMPSPRLVSQPTKHQ